MECVIIPNGAMFEVWSEGECLFTRPDKMECCEWANGQGYTIKN